MVSCSLVRGSRGGVWRGRCGRGRCCGILVVLAFWFEFLGLVKCIVDQTRNFVRLQDRIWCNENRERLKYKRSVLRGESGEICSRLHHFCGCRGSLPSHSLMIWWGSAHSTEKKFRYSTQTLEIAFGRIRQLFIHPAPRVSAAKINQICIILHIY